MSRLQVAPRSAGPLLGLRDSDRPLPPAPPRARVRARRVRARSARDVGRTPAVALPTTNSGADGGDLIDVGGARISRGEARGDAPRAALRLGRAHGGLLAALLALAACAGGPVPPPGWSGPFDTATVLARATEAAGGAAAQRPGTLHSKSRLVLYPPSGAPIDATLEIYAEEPGRFRREVVTATGRSVIQVEADGKQIELEDGRPTGIDHSRDWPRSRRYRHLLEELAAPGPQPARLVADPGADPDTTIVVERELVPDERWQAWFDAKTLLLARVRCLSREAGRDTVDEDFLSNHERIGERVVPRRQVTWQGGRRVKETLLLELEVGVALDPELFEIVPDAPEDSGAPARK
jgi:hypothetical protein